MFEDPQCVSIGNKIAQPAKQKKKNKGQHISEMERNNLQTELYVGHTDSYCLSYGDQSRPLAGMSVPSNVRARPTLFSLVKIFKKYFSCSGDSMLRLCGILH